MDGLVNDEINTMAIRKGCVVYFVGQETKASIKKSWEEEIERNERVGERKGKREKIGNKRERVR